MLYEVISQPRSGSTYLYRVLRYYLGNSKINYRHTNEIFAEWHFGDWNNNRQDPAKVLNRLIQLHGSGNIAVKHHQVHLDFFEQTFPDLYQKYIDLPRKRIVLIRDDVFEKTLSLMIAEHYDIWYEQIDELKPIRLDHDLFRTMYKDTLIMHNRLYDVSTSADLVINYNQLTFWPRKDFYNLGLFNDIDFNSLPKAKTITRNPPKKQTILNIDEIKNIYYTEFA